MSLFVDGKEIAINTNLFNFNTRDAVLKAEGFPFNSGSKTVEIFEKHGMITNKFKVLVDGKYVGGDKF